MPLAKTQLERNTFVRGLVTEASPLTFPENASIDEDNFVLNRDGSRQRRLGMDFETQNVMLDTGKGTSVFDSHNISTYRWSNVANDPTLSFGVIQVGNNLWFVDLYSSTLSANVKNGGVPYVLNSATLGYNISGNTLLDFTSINGQLVMASKELQAPIRLEYNKGSDSFSVTHIDIKVRDIWGVDDGLEVDFHPTTLSNLHEYNLYNQGWPYAFTILRGVGTTDTAINAYFLDRGFYPNNSDIWYFGNYINPATAAESFNGNRIKLKHFGTTPAPKGNFVIDAFSRGADRISKSGVGGLPADNETGRISVVSAFASRLFYSGVESSVSDSDALSPNFSGTVFFTQIIENNDHFSKCYQEADPTSEEISDLVATDGGTIKISEAGQILSMIVKDASLVVIADNGVWEITGRDKVFKADDFSITKITNVGAISKGSIVNVEGTIMYWSEGGIYNLSPDEVTGTLTASNVTEFTIQSFYNDIPSVGRANAVANYDPAAKKVRWLYNDTDTYDGINLRKKFNKELVLDLVLQAFYKNTIGESSVDSPFVAGYISTENFVVLDNIQDVVVNGEQVQVLGEDVIVTEEVRGRGVSQTKYLVFQPNQFGSNYGMSFGIYNNTDFKDWDDVDAAAYLVTGHELFGDTMRRKQVNYLIMHFLRTETGFVDTGGGNLEAVGSSSALIRSRWDFSNSEASGKWGTQFQAYRLRRAYFPTDALDPFDYGWEVITTKNRLRGSGRALSLRIDTEPGKDLNLLGWAIDATGSTTV